MTDKVKPELAGGFRDYLPQDMLARNKMLETIKAVFERFGFLPMDTPGLERSDVLGKEDADFLIYRAGLEGAPFDEAQGKQNMALRYDLTVPLARVVAANPDLPRPFKRYQFGRVWRGEKQQTAKGRWREFTQLDVDIVGSDSPQADAEIVSLMYETMIALGLTGFVIKVNNRKLLSGLPAEALRILDKLDKTGQEAVRRELTEKFDEATVAAAEKLFSKVTVNGELEELIANARALGVPEEKITVDNTLVRGLSYYTGNIFETAFTAPDQQSLGSVFSGGRYDNLVGRFAPFSIPAVGASVGVDRLFTALDQMELLPRIKTTAKVLVLNFDPDGGQFVQGVCADLRRADIAAELYLGQEETLKGQLAYAVKQEYPLVVIAGPQEREQNILQVKDMAARSQVQVKRRDVIKTIQVMIPGSIT